MPIQQIQVQEEVSIAQIDDARVVLDLYFSRFGVRLDSRYAHALQTFALPPDQKVELLHDLLILTDFVLDSLPNSPLVSYPVSHKCHDSQ